MGYGARASNLATSLNPRLPELHQDKFHACVSALAQQCNKALRGAFDLAWQPQWPVCLDFRTLSFQRSDSVVVLWDAPREDVISR